MENEPQGSLTVRIPETFGTCYLPAVIKEFHSRFPKVQLRFVTCAHEGLQKDLRKGVTDLAFLLAESIQAADLMAEVLRFESVVLVASRDHPIGSENGSADQRSGGGNVPLFHGGLQLQKNF